MLLLFDIVGHWLSHIRCQFFSTSSTSWSQDLDSFLAGGRKMAVQAAKARPTALMAEMDDKII